ncbi:MAG: hypothetical protein M5U25_13265 [Planctomycetota bacterium]|nr:hypothetical protein [Planctomycetota bacterium]
MPVLDLDQIDAVRADVKAAWQDDDLAADAVLRFYRTLGLAKPRIMFARSLHEAASVLSGGMEKFRRIAVRRFRAAEDYGHKYGHEHPFRNALHSCGARAHDLWLDASDHSGRGNNNAAQHFPAKFTAAEIELEEIARGVWSSAFNHSERLQLRLNGCSPMSLLWGYFRPFVVTPLWTDAWPKVCALECLCRQGVLRLSTHDRELVSTLFSMLSNNRSAVLSRNNVVVCDPPVYAELDELGRPHSLNGPALTWGDGSAAHAINGCWVPQHAVVEPQRITLLEIELEPDESVQARLIDRYGLDQYLHNSKALVLDRTGSFELLYKAQATCDALLVLRNTGDSEHHQQCVFRVPASVVSAADALAWLKASEFTSFQP